MVRVAERDSDALGLLRGRTGLRGVAYQPLRATQGSGDRKVHFAIVRTTHIYPKGRTFMRLGERALKIPCGKACQPCK